LNILYVHAFNIRAFLFSFWDHPSTQHSIFIAFSNLFSAMARELLLLMFKHRQFVSNTVQ